MPKYYEATEQKDITDSSGAPHKVEDAIDLSEIKITLEQAKPKAAVLRNTLERLEDLIFDVTGNPNDAVKNSEAVRGSLVKTYRATKESLAELRNEFAAGLVSGTSPTAVKNPDVSLFENSLTELEKLLDEYIEKIEPYFSDQEKLDSKIFESTLKTEPEAATPVERFLRKQDLAGILRGWFTLDLNSDDQPRYAAIEQYNRHLNELETDFLNHCLNQGETEHEAALRWNEFRNLVDQTFGLTDYGIMRADTLNTDEGTAKHDKLLESDPSPTDKGQAMELNRKFNKNKLVNVEGLHPGEQNAPNMGIIQMICFAAYQRARCEYTDDINDPDLTKSFFSRNESYKSDTMTQLIDYVCEMDQVPMWDGIMVPVNIKAELEKYPKETHALLKQTALWKYARDDLGTLAGIWLIGKHRGSFKFNDGGKGRPAGLLGAIPYQVGKKSREEGHLAATAFMTPEKTEFMNGNTKDSVVRTDKATKIAIERLDRLEVAENPQLLGLLYEEHAGRMEGLEKYEPKHWWQDFPALSEFFNRTEDVYSGGLYTKSRDAVMTIISKAIRAPLLEISPDPSKMEKQIIALIDKLGTEIGKTFSYCGVYNDGTGFYNGDKTPARRNVLIRPDKINPNNHVLEMILAAAKYYLANILMAIPLGEDLSIAGNVRRGVIRSDYDRRYDRATSIIEKAINNNSTLTVLFQPELTGKGDPARDSGFVHQDFRKRWHNPKKRENEYRTWVVKNVPEKQNLSILEESDFMSEPIRGYVDPTEGWSSNSMGAEKDI